MLIGNKWNCALPTQQCGASEQAPRCNLAHSAAYKRAKHVFISLPSETKDKKR